MPFWKHLRAILLLPFTVTVIIPALLLSFAHPFDTRWPDRSGLVQLSQLTAAAFLLLGILLLVLTNLLFARIGKGTLAPWDPTSRLVVQGPYRLVRNPMISGVLMILAAEALFTGSALLATWTLLFFAITHFHFLLREEPALASRFGDDYRSYHANVPRWIPRKTPWDRRP